MARALYGRDRTRWRRAFHPTGYLFGVYIVRLTFGDHFRSPSFSCKSQNHVNTVWGWEGFTTTTQDATRPLQKVQSAIECIFIAVFRWPSSGVAQKQTLSAKTTSPSRARSALAPTCSVWTTVDRGKKDLNGWLQIGTLHGVKKSSSDPEPLLFPCANPLNLWSVPHIHAAAELSPFFEDW